MTALHDSQVTKELVKLMLLFRDMEELKSHSLSEVVSNVYLIVVRVSILPLYLDQI